MPRKRSLREPCDCLDCKDLLPVSTTLSSAIARQQPPPKCLVLYLADCFHSRDSQPPATCSTAQLPHVDKIVDQGSSGLLAMREGQPLESSLCDRKPSLQTRLLDSRHPASRVLFTFCWHAEEGSLSGSERIILRNIFGAIPVSCAACL